jgi:hypothetical protein
VRLCRTIEASGPRVRVPVRADASETLLRRILAIVQTVAG